MIRTLFTLISLGSCADIPLERTQTEIIAPFFNQSEFKDAFLAAIYSEKFKDWLQNICGSEFEADKIKWLQTYPKKYGYTNGTALFNFPLIYATFHYDNAKL